MSRDEETRDEGHRGRGAGPARVAPAEGISLREIADSTKISIRFLQAIEEGDFKRLPGGIYTTSYIRQYAREIGLEEVKLLAYFQAATAVAS